MEFSWEGNDEEDHAFGRGWAVLDGDELQGMIFIHCGESSGFVTSRAEKKTGPKRK